jgi:glycosyltransferase involved in cell wall biosynthesis
MNVLWLTTFPPEAACTRYRCVQYFRYLETRGVSCTLRPFLPPELFRKLYVRSGLLSKIPRLLAAAARRIRDVISAGDFDAVFVQREAALFGPPVVEWLLARLFRKPLIFDFDDAIFVHYTSPTYGRAATWLKFPGKTASTIRMSRAVIAGNEHLAAYARKFRSDVTVIPTVVDAGGYRPAEPKPSRRLSTVGWIGSPTTTPYFETLLPVLARISDRRAFRLKVVGANRTYHLPRIEVANEPWTLEGEISHFQSLDIGLYPVPENEWSIGKSGFKAIQYMAAGVPCVASPVGANSEIIRDGDNGLLASDQADWVEKVTALLDDDLLRARLAASGFETVSSRYSTAVQAPRLAEVILAAARERPKR